MKHVSTVAIAHPTLKHLFLHGKRRDNFKWALPGGHANEGENEFDTARRELREETGLQIKEMERCRNGCFVNPEGDEVYVTLFLGSTPEDLDVHNHGDPDHEFLEFRFLDPTGEYDFHIPSDRNILVDHIQGKKYSMANVKKVEPENKGKDKNELKIRTQGRVFVSMDGDNIGASVERAALSDNLKTIILQSKIIAKGQQLIRIWAKKYDADIYIDGGDDIAMTLPRKYIKYLDLLRQAYGKATGFTVTIGYGDSISRAGKAMLYGKLHGKDQINEWTPKLDKKLEQVAKQLTPQEKYQQEGLLGKEEQTVALKTARINKQT